MTHQMISIVALVAEHHVAGPTPAPTDTALQRCHPIELLQVHVAIQDGQWIVRNTLQALLYPSYIM